MFLRLMFFGLLLASGAFAECSCRRRNRTTTSPTTLTTTTPSTTAKSTTITTSTAPLTTTTTTTPSTTTPSTTANTTTVTTSTTASSTPKSTTTTTFTTPLTTSTTNVPKDKVFVWDVNTSPYGWLQHNLVHLDKNLANDPQAYIDCFKKTYNMFPETTHYNYNTVAYGRKKRDVVKGIKKFGTEIPFLVSENFTLCEKRRIALIIRKLETRTCLKFIPYNGKNEHQTPPLIITTVWVSGGQNCRAPWGQVGVGDSSIDGVKYQYAGLMELKSKCLWKSIEHEFMHILGFVHTEESPFRELPPELEKQADPPGGAESTVERLIPWDRNSAVGSPGVQDQRVNPGMTLTDWDVYKINKVYDCKRTAYGDQVINMKNTPAPVVNKWDDLLKG